MIIVLASTLSLAMSMSAQVITHMPICSNLQKITHTFDSEKIAAEAHVERGMSVTTLSHPAPLSPQVTSSSSMTKRLRRKWSLLASWPQADLVSVEQLTFMDYLLNTGVNWIQRRC